MTGELHSQRDIENGTTESNDLRSLPIIPFVIGLIFISMASLVIIFAVAFTRLDEQAQLNLKERAEDAFAVEFNRTHDSIIEYSYWDEAYEGLVLTQSDEFIEENIDAYLYETYDIEISLALDGNNAPLVAHINGERSQFSLEQVNAFDLVSLIEQAHSAEYPFIANGYRTLDGEAYLVTAGAFISYDTEEPHGNGSTMVFARRLDTKYLEYIANYYNLPELKLTSKNSINYPPKLTLNGENGEVIASLWWADDEIADKHIMTMLPFMVIVFILLLGITWLVMKRDQNNRKAYTDQLLKLANKDFLTGISNRREFFSLAMHELKRSKRSRSPSCLLMLDIDHFKRINDTLGHEGGDKVLLEFTKQVKLNLREVDLFARIGGEEFCVLLVNTDQEAAYEVAERIRKAIKECHLEHAQTMTFTVSAGLGMWNGEETLDQLLKRVDEALYLAKFNGRNQTRISEF